MAATTYIRGPGIVPHILFTYLHYICERGDVFNSHCIDGEIKASMWKPLAWT